MVVKGQLILSQAGAPEVRDHFVLTPKIGKVDFLLDEPIAMQLELNATMYLQYSQQIVFAHELKSTKQ